MKEMTKDKTNYYEKVAGHFNEDARLFEKRYDENPILKIIRNDFRIHTEKHSFTNALEIGCGPGIDLAYFATRYPERNFYGFDVSPEMVRIANSNIQKAGCSNAIAKTGSVEQIEEMFPGISFDMIYVYFGGLNTVYNLKETVRILHRVADENATIVLSCVNRYYLLDFFVRMLRLKFSEATARFRNRWKGYSPGRNLRSYVYSYRFIRKNFTPEFSIQQKRGYSLFYPPWYAVRHLHKLKGLAPLLWKTDKLLQHTFLWNTGEYSLYIMKKKNHKIR